MTRDFAQDADYGRDPLLPETGPIDIGSVPTAENNEAETLRICLVCELIVGEGCHCDIEGA